MTDKELTREEWLYRAAARLQEEILEPAGYPGLADYPLEEAWTNLRITCSWPSTGGLRNKKRVLGECWGIEASAGKLQEIFISPTLDDAVRVCDVLIHEMLHGAVGTKQKHNRTFARACVAVGLDGKPTATEAGPELTDRINAILATLPAYPHRKVEMVRKPKQGTRQLKAWCTNPDCETQAEGGFLVRVTRKWIERFAIEGSVVEEDGSVGIKLACPECGWYMVADRQPS